MVISGRSPESTRSNGSGACGRSPDPAGASAADREFQAARDVYEHEGAKPALPRFERALAAYRADANRRGDARISSAESDVSAWVIPTNEELMIARHTYACVVGREVRHAD